MSGKTGIQWTDSTWNVVTGCTRVSPGCARCYIERTPPFRMSGRRFAKTGDGEASTGVTLHWDRLGKVPPGPKVFTPSLGDLFHEDVPVAFIASVFVAMAYRPDRVFQVLTKRPERAFDVLTDASVWEKVAYGYASRFEDGDNAWDFAYAAMRDGLRNVWLGVSIENARYTWRADALREIPAAVRFISAEPLLGSLYDGRSDATVQDGVRTAGRPLPVSTEDDRRHARSRSARGTDGEQHAGGRTELARGGGALGRAGRAQLDLTGISWAIIGGESGPGARPFHLAHAREIIRAARDAGTAVFVKQLGSNPVGKTFIPTTHNPTTFSLRLGDVPLKLRDRKGGEMSEWPADLRVREFPRAAP